MEMCLVEDATLRITSLQWLLSLLVPFRKAVTKTRGGELNAD